MSNNIFNAQGVVVESYDERGRHEHNQRGEEICPHGTARWIYCKECAIANPIWPLGLAPIDQPTTPTPWHGEPLQWDQGASIAICSTGAEAQIVMTIAPENEDDDPDMHTAKRGPCDVGNAVLTITAVNTHAELMEMIGTAARMTKDRECTACHQDGDEPNPECNDPNLPHEPWDMESDDAVETLHGLISQGRELMAKVEQTRREAIESMTWALSVSVVGEEERDLAELKPSTQQRIKDGQAKYAATGLVDQLYRALSECLERLHAYKTLKLSFPLTEALARAALKRADEAAALPMAEQIEALERELITEALAASGGVIVHAARALGFNHHQSLIALLDGRHKDLRALCAKPRRLRSIIKKGGGRENQK